MTRPDRKIRMAVACVLAGVKHSEVHQNESDFDVCPSAIQFNLHIAVLRFVIRDFVIRYLPKHPHHRRLHRDLLQAVAVVKLQRRFIS
jgi:hypothetical protein